jgi:N-acetylneuraminic acid mutarotase
MITFRNAAALVALAVLASPAPAGDAPPRVDEWPLLPEAISSFGAARDGDWAYVYGGHAGAVHHHSADTLWPAFMRLNLLDGRTWESLPMQQHLQSPAVVAHGGKIYRIGGLSARNRAADPDDLWSVASASRYDPLARTWEELPALPEPRSSHDVAVIGEKLYVVGGWGLAGDLVTWHQTAWVMDLAETPLAWKAAPAPPFERRALALAVVDGKLWALGGMDSTEEKGTKAVAVLDPATGTWSAGPDLPFNGFGVAAAVIGQDLLVSGIGSGVHRLGLYGDAPEWEEVATLAFPRYFHRLLTLGQGERLLALGGTSEGGHLRVCETIDLRPAGPSLVSFVVPEPGLAKNRQGIALHRNSLYLVGGNNSFGQHDFKPENFLQESWRLHLGSLRVERLVHLPTPRQTMSSTIVAGAKPYGADDRALFVGGFGNDGHGPRAWPTVFQLHLGERKWVETEAALPVARTQFGLVQHAGKLLLVGGVDFDGARPKEQQFQFPTDVLEWDLKAGKTFAPAGLTIPSPRRAFGGALLGGSYYVVGGMKEGFSLLGDVDVLDLTARTWTKAPAPARPRISPELVAVGGKLYLIGGTSPVTEGSQEFMSNPDVEVFDPAANAWSTLCTLPIETRHMTAMAWRDRLLFYSAHVEGVRAMRVHVLTVR